MDINININVKNFKIVNFNINKTTTYKKSIFKKFHIILYVLIYINEKICLIFLKII